MGHPDAGWRSAVMYSIMGTCKLQGVNPYDYLVWALPRLASGTTATIGDVTPSGFLSAVKRAALSVELCRRGASPLKDVVRLTLTLKLRHPAFKDLEFLSGSWREVVNAQSVNASH